MRFPPWVKKYSRSQAVVTSPVLLEKSTAAQYLCLCVAKHGFEHRDSLAILQGVEGAYLGSKHTLHRLQQLVGVVCQRPRVFLKHAEQGASLWKKTPTLSFDEHDTGANG
ncbi:hypothetical protein EYF80_013777 [Liparis tanakae]|uniref:Uncharacterized protein n=1 Tax=Liparis tanakae TaxID=230148 RepID=A0A4Z2IEZ1_9TELE|nr:hypothetical protein EYF80_013777 [Liparis tanakae]